MGFNKLIKRTLENSLEHFFLEDDIARNFRYINSLPKEEVEGYIFFKSDMIIAGLPYFFHALHYIGMEWTDEVDAIIEKYEGMRVKKDDKVKIYFKLPFAVALVGERIALNLLQQASSIATCAASFAELAKTKNIKILDTRKTTPGLRSLEKYAVTVGGGYNHRLGSCDVWMVKDNHKEFFGGIENAVNFFRNLAGFYCPIEVEIHKLEELPITFDLGIKHVMLDNFTPDQIREALKIKPSDVTYEVSGGVRMENIKNYLIEGVDAISMGCITYDAPHVDVSFKYHKQEA